MFYIFFLKGNKQKANTILDGASSHHDSHTEDATEKVKRHPVCTLIPASSKGPHFWPVLYIGLYANQLVQIFYFYFYLKGNNKQKAKTFVDGAPSHHYSQT